MSDRTASAGSASVEYLALLGVMVMMFVGLLTLTPHRVSKRAPVDVIPPIVRLLGRPLESPRPMRPPPAAPRPPAVPRPRRIQDPPPRVLLPQWWR